MTGFYDKKPWLKTYPDWLPPTFALPDRSVLDLFTASAENYPDDPYATKAQELYRLCLKSLAEHDLYVGLFYYRTKHYEAALERFKAVVHQYPDVGAHQTALRYIAACEIVLAAAAEEAE